MSKPNIQMNSLGRRIGHRGRYRRVYIYFIDQNIKYQIYTGLAVDDPFRSSSRTGDPVALPFPGQMTSAGIVGIVGLASESAVKLPRFDEECGW